MKPGSLQLNLLAAWIAILLGFLSGLGLGLFFHRDQWLGGYASFKRRLYRLAHISLFALGLANLCFYFTARELVAPGLTAASWAFVLGAASMPVCCLATAHWPAARMWFAVPVLSLVLGGLITVMAIAGGARQENPGAPASSAAPASVASSPP